MSARGARSRKVQQKDIQKQETKIARSGKSPVPIQEERDAFATWRFSPSNEPSKSVLTRSITASSTNSRTNSRSGSAREGNSRPTLNVISSAASSDSQDYQVRSFGAATGSISDGSSSKGKEKTKFQANGKETSAPRGRGGGVPLKRNATPTASAPLFREIPEHAHIPPDQRTWKDFRVWNGRQSDRRPYHGFALDEDMQEGNVLIFFKEEQRDEDHPTPSIRAHLEILQQSGSIWLENALAYGRIDDEDVDEWMKSHHQDLRNFPQSLSPASDKARPQRMLGPVSPDGYSPPPLEISRSNTRTDSSAGSEFPNLVMSDRQGGSHSPPPFQKTTKHNPTHEIWFTAPSAIQTRQGQRLHHVAIRNFLALLHGKPIVGADMFEMLVTLHSEIQVMYDLGDGGRAQLTARDRSTQMITNYLGQHGLDDVRNDTKHALGILAWSEQDNTKWRHGYLECFVHLAGLMSPEIEDMVDFKRLSIITRRNLSLAGKTLRLHIMEAEETLATFDFKVLWEDSTKATAKAVYQSYEAFREFLVAHYKKTYGSWPPVARRSWLDRKLVHTLQQDFGALYDYIVDRDVFWNPREERASRKWEMAHRRNDAFQADFPDLNITNMLVTFDAKQGYAHIPHPYPLLPREVSTFGKDKEKRGFFSSLRREKAKDATHDAKAHLQLSILFSDATNIEKADVDFDGSTLIDKFEQFELTTDLKNSSPREARLGRWVLLYGILQVLSTLSVDVQGLKYTEDVHYFLCPELKRLPEWVTNSDTEYLEACQQRSWCWQRSWDPAPVQKVPVELEALSVSTYPTDADRFKPNSIMHPHSLPSPPPDRKLPIPPSPSLDGVTLMQHDIRRIQEKIESFSHSQMEHQTHSRYLSPEGLVDYKTPVESSKYDPRMESLPLHSKPDMLKQLSKLDNAYQLEGRDFLRPRSQRTSVNSDLGAYSMSANDPRQSQWPVPPGYSQSSSHRDGTSLGSGYANFSPGTEELRREADDFRSPRRTHQSRVWK